MDNNLSLYHIFYVVAQKKGISQAAKELFISQPAVSKAIARLEDNLNTILFIRSPRGVTLTEEGQLLYEHTKEAFHALDLGEKNLQRHQALGMGQLRIGVSTTLCKYLLLPYLKDFIEKHPHIKITIDCQSTFHTIKALGDNKIDLGLIGQPKDLKNLTFYPIGAIEDIFVATKTYLDNLELREGDSQRDILSSSNLMLLDEENITRIYIEDYFREQQITPSQVLEISNMDLLIEFAKIGLGVACVIKEFVQKELEEGTLVEIPLTAPIAKRQVGFSYSKNAFLSDSMEKFLTFCQ